ncbi:MAG: hypothetical protein ABIS28_08645, partial [Caldimonas sp.]
QDESAEGGEEQRGNVTHRDRSSLGQFGTDLFLTVVQLRGNTGLREKNGVTAGHTPGRAGAPVGIAVAKIAPSQAARTRPSHRTNLAKPVNPLVKWCSAQKGKRTHEWA